MTPAIACVEMMQCLAQAMPVSVRKGGGKMGDALAPLLQLPGVDQEVIKRLRKRKINSLADLQVLPDSQRAAELSWTGMDAVAAEGVQLFLSAMPKVQLAARFEVDGEEEIMEGDPVHCKVRVLLSRPSHKAEGFQLRGSAVRAYTPYNPVPRDEAWYFFLTEPSTNSVLAWQKVNLMEAERAGLDHPEAFISTGDAFVTTTSSSSNNKGDIKAADDSNDVLPGQEVDLIFVAPKTASYSLSLVAMSDCWVGVDENVQLKLKVAPLSRAVAEGRAAATAKKVIYNDSEDEDGSGSDGEGSSGSGSDDEDDYDSEETGEEESEAEEEGDSDELPALEKE